MEVFEIVVALLLGGAALAAVARHVGAPYPALVALAGAALALVPGVSRLVLDPELALFVAPDLVDAPPACTTTRRPCAPRPRPGGGASWRSGTTAQSATICPNKDNIK